MNKITMAYAVKHKDENIRAASRSGGIFTAVSDFVLKNGGVVYGCVLENPYTAVHIRATTTEERNKMRGSKYIQSDTRRTFSECAADLKAGLMVLYTGTPCQIFGLLCYLDTLNIDKKRLITVDIVCHATASPKIWEKYVKYETNGIEPDNVNFRDKEKFGWAAHYETITVGGADKSGKKFADVFYKDLPFPTHCFDCKFKTVKRFSDITIGDYWHIGELDKNFADDKGISLVLVNSEKGNEIFKSIEKNITFKIFPLCLSMQKPFESNYSIPAKRDEFFRDADKMDFFQLHQKYTTPNPPSKIRKIIDIILKYSKKVASIGR